MTPTPETDPIVTKDSPIVLAALEPTDRGPRKAIMYRAVVRVARVSGTPLEREVRVLAQVLREGAIVRVLLASGFELHGDPERAWLTAVGTELRLMVGTVGAKLRAHLVSFGAVERDRAAERRELRAILRSET